MRESSERRDTVPPGGNAWRVGDKVKGAIDGVGGTVVHVSNVVAALVSVEWNDGNKEAVIYPADTIMIERAMPWE